MNQGELTTFLRDHNIPSVMMKSDEILSLIRAVNLKILKIKGDIQHVSFLGFQEFLA